MKKVYIFLIEITIIGVIVFLVSYYLLQIIFVQGPSMEPTYKNGQMLIIKKYKTEIKRSNVIVIKKDGKTIIKRVIGIPNDRIIIKEGFIYVNEEKYDNNSIEKPGNAENEIQLNTDEYFVLGDNRNESIDSRFDEVGIIKKHEILGVIM